ncbi:NAD(P)H-dependent oxidoreductase [Campylobacter fetus]|uniref:NAD(P)H-dependent oxidoreductase n=1 Tax=Campylobacter fetus TaxID=196 RepID=UPI00073A59F4|nr:NAD(P)H-dependent oxidoreductase [Campylobacter fetus]ALV65337.1 flavodoxin-like fold domain protein, putative NAD(P)H (quinone) dehydrogenase/reductase [Campylobacter fetus subsp. testudinum Sp3]OCS01064.1 NAD(P)H oxidoreductase [Campylobacter fetus subsp. testudinum]
MKTLIILSHPDIENGIFNKKLRNEVQKNASEVKIHELYKVYKDYTFDIKKEQKLLESYEKIIFQFPLYWYSCPPLLKKYFDDIFEYGWAYGDNADKLKGKIFGLCISAAGKEYDFDKSGEVGFSMKEVLIPFEATAKFVGAKFIDSFITFEVESQISEEKLQTRAKEYLEYLKK